MVSTKTKTTKVGKPKKKALTKKQKVTKRASKMQKMIQYRKKLKKSRKGKVVPIKRKKQAEADHEIIDFATQQAEFGASEAQINILNVLGLGEGANNNQIGNMQNDSQNWEKILEDKLKQANHRSLQNPEVRRMYGQIGKIFATYRSGKIPKAFKVIPNLQKWKQILIITRPDNWTPQAMYQAVNIFASNFDAVRAQQFYAQFLTPAIKNDLQKNKKLNYHYYQSLKKALYKTNAWFKGIMFHFCHKNALSREISVIESLLSKMTIPVISSSVAIIKLTQLQPNTAIYHYLKAFVSKSYNFPRKVIIILTKYLLKFGEIKEQLPVIWQQFFLTFVRQYNSSIDQMQKSTLIDLAKRHNHKQITPQIIRQLS